MTEWVFDVANTITVGETGERLVIGKRRMSDDPVWLRDAMTWMKVPKGTEIPAEFLPRIKAAWAASDFYELAIISSDLMVKSPRYQHLISRGDAIESDPRAPPGFSLIAEYRRIARAHSRALSRIAELEAEAEKSADAAPDSDKKPPLVPKPLPAGALKPPSGDPRRVGG